MSQNHKVLTTNLPPGLSSRFIAELREAIPVSDFKGRYLQEEILSKYCDASTTPSSVRSDAAIEKFMAAEASNCLTNSRLYTSDGTEILSGTTWYVLRKRIRKIVSQVLGHLVYETIFLDGNHTNGASPRVRRSSKAMIEKLIGTGEVTESALKHWFTFASGTFLSSQELRIVDSSTLFTVPKRSDIDRVACKEPEINMLLQRSVGNHIRKRLRKYGVDLNDQTVNQRLASIGVSKKLATIDLSSASDSISRQLVFDLLPFDWWSLLSDLRVERTLIKGSSHYLEMFSSMGNGFTFELESLLFYAITKATCDLSQVRGKISVYGDDIIAPSRIVPRLMRVFSFLGFRVNAKKTHYKGLFRESCGKHYHDGVDVSPFYIRREIVSVIDLVNLLNQVLKWDSRGTFHFWSESLEKFHLKYRAHVPKRLWGGIDPNDPTSLVTGDLPRMRIIPITRPVPCRTSLYSQDEFEAKKLMTWFLQRRDDDNIVVIDPRYEIAYRYGKRNDLGARTPYIPYVFNTKG